MEECRFICKMPYLYRYTNEPFLAQMLVDLHCSSFHGLHNIVEISAFLLLTQLRRAQEHTFTHNFTHSSVLIHCNRPYRRNKSRDVSSSLPNFINRVGQNHIYIRCLYGIFRRDFIKHTVTYGEYIQSWPTLLSVPLHTHTHITSCTHARRLWMT